MVYRNRAIFDVIRRLAFGAIGANFAVAGAAFATPPRWICLNNMTDATIQFSFDGAVLHLELPPRSFKVIDVTANKVRDDGYFLKEGDFIWMRHDGVAPTAGSAFCEIMRS